MLVPDHHQEKCEKCPRKIVKADTGRKAKGLPVLVTLDPEEDDNGGSPSNLWVLSLYGRFYVAGQPKTKNQRAGMTAAGIRFHREHVCRGK